MELRQLKSFIKTAETLNFSEAAKQLSISQSTLSQQIKALEDELETTLFVRDTHSVLLSESGEAMLPLARQTVNDAENCYTQIKDLKTLASGRLNIGISYSFEHLISETLMEFIELYPGVRVNIFIRTNDELIEMLRKREVDFALAFKNEAGYENIESDHLFDDNIVAVAHKNHPVAQLESISVDSLLRNRIIMPSKNMIARHMSEKFSDSVYQDKNLLIEVNNVNTVLDLLEAGNMVSIITGTAIMGRTNLAAVPLELKDSALHCCIHTLKKAYQKKSAEIFISMLRRKIAINI